MEIDFGKHAELDGGYRIPVGSVVCTHSKEYTVILEWWAPPSKLGEIKELARPFTSCGGFTFHTGKKINSSTTESHPEVILEEWQQRDMEMGGHFSRNCNMVAAYVGYTLVWLEIDDPVRALTCMDTFTALPCAPRCDILRYNTEPAYFNAWQKASELFIHYCTTGKPKPSKEALIREDKRIRREGFISVADL